MGLKTFRLVILSTAFAAPLCGRQSEMRAAINFRGATWIRFESVFAQHNTTDRMGWLYVDRDFLDRHDSPD